MRISIYTFVFIALLSTPLMTNAEVSISSSFTIKPGNPDNAAKQLVEESERLNGYFVKKSSQSVVLKVPNAEAEKVNKFIGDTWQVYQHEYHANDITGELIEVESKLKAKEELLSEYEKILSTAGANDVVTVATSVTELVKEIELLRGRVQYLKHKAQYATISVQFSIDRKRIDNRGKPSSFPWINKVGLPNLISAFSK